MSENTRLEDSSQEFAELITGLIRAGLIFIIPIVTMFIIGFIAADVLLRENITPLLIVSSLMALASFAEFLASAKDKRLLV